MIAASRSMVPSVHAMSSLVVSCMVAAFAVAVTLVA